MATPLHSLTPGPGPDVEGGQLAEVMEKLKKQAYELGGGFNRMQVSFERFADNMGKIAELSGRLTYLLAMLGGVPRSFAHGAIPMFLYAGLHGKGGYGGTGSMSHEGGSQSGPGGTGNPFTPRALAERIRHNYERQMEYHIEVLASGGNLTGGSSAENKEAKIKLMQSLPEQLSHAEMLADPRFSNVAKITPGSVPDPAKPYNGPNFFPSSPAPPKTMMEKMAAAAAKPLHPMAAAMSAAAARAAIETSHIPTAGVPAALAVAGVPIQGMGPPYSPLIPGTAGVEATPATAGVGYKPGAPGTDRLFEGFFNPIKEAGQKLKQVLGGPLKDFFGIGKSKFGVGKQQWDSMSGGEKAHTAIQSMGQHAARTLMLGGAMAGGALASGAPDAFATLKGSISLFSGELGSALIPASVQLAALFQDLAERVRNMSDSTKQFWVGFAKWGAYLGIGALVLAKVISVVGTLYTGVVTLGAAVGAAAAGLFKLATMNFGGLTAKQGVLGGIAGVAGIAALAYGVYQMLRPKTKEEKEQEQERILFTRQKEISLAKKFEPDTDLLEDKTLSQNIKRMAEAAGVGLDEAARRLAGIETRPDLGEQQDLVKKLAEQNKDPERMISSGYAKFLRPTIDKFGDATSSDLIKRLSIGGNLLQPEKRKQLTEELVTSLTSDMTSKEAAAERTKRLGELLEEQRTGIKAPGRASETEVKTEFERKTRRRELLYSLSSQTTSTPQYSAVEEVYKKVQLAALGQSPLDYAKQEQWQRDQLDTLREIRNYFTKNDPLKKVVDELEKNTEVTKGTSGTGK